MAEKKEYKSSDLYQGGYSSLNPEKGYGYGFVGTHSAASGMGMSTDARTANIIKEVSKNLSAGAKTVELNQVFPEVFESIPQGYFKEVNRLAKLTGIDVTMHAPLIEPSGFTKEGWSETNRQAAERQMKFAVEKAQELNPTGNSPIVFHSSAMLPGQIKPKGGEVEEVLVINPQKGSINRIPIKERHFPEEGKPNVKREIQEINKEVFGQQLKNIAYYSDIGIDAIEKSKYGKIASELEGKETAQEFQRDKSVFNRGVTFLNDSYREFKELYDTTYSSSSDNPEQKRILDELREEITKDVQTINKNPFSNESVILRKEIIDKGIETLNSFKEAPEIYKPLDEFAKGKTIQTFANVAWDSYKKVKDGKWKAAPIISIENPPVGGAFSTGQELKDVVEKSRDKFIEIAKREGMSESEAKREAEKLIGATWDVGHINMMRKYGYEAKDIVKETEQIAPLVKHIHLSDNFGYEHTELPMGMGNVPMKEIMEKIDKEGYQGKKIIEALHWWQHHSENGAIPPLQPSLEAFGSPIYSMKMQPYWNQAAGFQQGYFSGYGTMLPQGNYNTFGAGFSQLPSELGGQMPGQQGGRLSGNKME